MHHIIKHKPAVDTRKSKYAPKFYFEVIFTEVEYPEDDHEQDAAAEDDGEGGVPPGVTTVILTMTVLHNLHITHLGLGLRNLWMMSWILLLSSSSSMTMMAPGPGASSH